MTKTTTPQGDTGEAATWPPPELQTFPGAVAWVQTRLERLVPFGERYEQDQFRYHGEVAILTRPDDLVSCASNGFGAHIALRFGIASLLEGGKELPQSAKVWLTEYLRGNRPQPSAPTGKPPRWGVHIFLEDMADLLVSCGWKLTRNEASDGFSAFDVIAKAMSNLDLSPSTYDGVKRAYYDLRKETVRRALAARHSRAMGWGDAETE